MPPKASAVPKASAKCDGRIDAMIVTQSSKIKVYWKILS
jgi:hypothetical protein